MLEEDENQFLEEYDLKKRKGSTEKDGNAFFWCHQCKQKHIEVVCCTKTCSKKYCTRCVWRHYKEKVEDVDKDNWVCYYCQGHCSCAFCRRRRAKETNTKFESHRGKKRSGSVSDENSSRKKRKTRSTCETKIDSSQIEKIYARCTKENKSIYLLKIKNESEVTWVPELDLTAEITSNFSSSQLLLLPTKPTIDSTIAETESDTNQDKTKIDKDVNNDIISIEPTNESSIQSSKSLKGKSLDSTCLQGSMDALNVLNDCSNDSPTKAINDKISLKDLLDSGILREGDILRIQNVDKTATLLGTGIINWGDTLFKSLEGFVKAAVGATKTDNKSSFRNNLWRKVNCRGKSLQYYTIKYQKRYTKPREVTSESKNEATKEEQISQVDLNEETIDESKSISENNKYELTQEIAVTPSPIDSSPSCISHDNNNGFLQNQTNSKNIANTLHNIQSQINDSIQEDDDIWNEEIVYFDQCYHSLVHFQHEEHDKDILVCGIQDQYLDIKDNDFFNVNNSDHDLIPRSYHSLEIEGWVDLKPN